MLTEPIIIESGRSVRRYWSDLWQYRELFYCLAWRDILVRYKQTVLGIAWSVLRPLATMVVFTLIFGRLAKMSSGQSPYAIMVFAGLLPWQFFSNAFSDASNSLLNSASLLTKVYFPRIIVPATSVLVSLIDFIISFLLLLFMMVFFSFTPDWKIIFVPFLLLWVFAFTLGCGLLISALTVKYRDFRHVVPFLIQFGLYISPVGFSSSVIPENWKLLYFTNPMAGIVDSFRYAILNEPLFWPGVGFSFAVSIVMLLVGFKYFRMVESSFADQI